MKEILIIEDDIHVSNLLEETLANAGYRVLKAYSGTEAMYVLLESKPNLILLDLMLPGLHGEEVLPHIIGIPVIILSAKIDIDNKVELLQNGAVDYVTKPFHMQELLARISIHLRNAEHVVSSSILTYHTITLNLDTHIVMVDGTEIKLTRTEYAILKVLMLQPSQITTKSYLLEHIGMDTPDCTESSLKMHISNLRKKLRGVDNKSYIEAVWGIGFKLSDI